jgi:divalent metal cation (Fe/Co/Zn/Cd) transporter
MNDDRAGALYEATAARHCTARRGRLLQHLTIAWNSAECLVALIAGFVAGSIALVGFGFDSAIEVTSSLAALWRLHRDADEARRDNAERRALRVIGGCFLLLATYVLYEAVDSLMNRVAPDHSMAGIVLAALSPVVMPLLARAKRRIARRLESGALEAETRQTEICAYLSAILLLGLSLNAWLGWWWADPVSALAMAPLIARAGWEAVRGGHVARRSVRDSGRRRVIAAISALLGAKMVPSVAESSQSGRTCHHAGGLSDCSLGRC